MRDTIMLLMVSKNDFLFLYFPVAADDSHTAPKRESPVPGRNDARISLRSVRRLHQYHHYIVPTVQRPAFSSLPRKSASAGTPGISAGSSTSDDGVVDDITAAGYRRFAS